MSFPRILLHLEGLAVCLVSCWVYSFAGGSWLFFALLFLAPDLSMIGYAAGKRVGAFLYNLAHTYVVALGMVAIGMLLKSDLLTSLGLIFCAHIGFDRLLGFGLKYPTTFRVTHLSRV
ncbi:MAG: DUF4260 domain-containing protein [Calditrichaeota bacterium]|nr:DUF4260 domain-containing protein [Calditrichota bacterium]MCB9366034.1 DUF4260 domain-containing protein [Calditrichota bacterium]MCB9391840.1 DUF4260 domain-containing protein [Calditrichota bacterium]